MKALIIEDEFPAADRLRSLLHKTAPTWELLGVLDSVSSAQDWLVSETSSRYHFLGYSALRWIEL